MGGDNTTSSVRRISQDLLTFSPGITQVSYVIGPIGSDAEAGAVIKSAEVSIKDAEDIYPEINLTASRKLLQEATISKFNAQYMDASTYGIEANNIVRRTVETIDQRMMLYLKQNYN